MSYVVLARKYRSRNFSEMVGQAHVVQALTNALTSQRLHHAYLFTGTRGVGKTTVSRILAKALNCTGPDGAGGITAEPCGVCPSCRDIDAGRFVDYTELDAASNRGVDEVQALLEQAVYKPVQGRFKVFMIDEVHMLSNTAFNAMLKTLEEPPEYLKFVLATTDPQKVPVTVLSRCLQFNLRPMAPETILEHLTHILSQEGVSAEEQALQLIARAARGSMRDALSLTDQAIAYGSGTLGEASVRQMLGSVDKSYVFGLLQALAQADGRAVVQTVDQLRQQGVAAASTLDEMTQALQRMAVLQMAPGASNSLEPDAAQLASLAQALPADETQLLYSLCLQGRGELGLAPDEYAALTMVLLRLLAFKTGGRAVQASSTESAEKKSPVDAGLAVLPAAPVGRPTVAAPISIPPVAVASVATTAPRQASATPSATPASDASVVVPQRDAPHQRAPASSAPQGLALPVRDLMGSVRAESRAADDLPPWESEAAPPDAKQSSSDWMEVAVHEQPSAGSLDREPLAQLADIPPSEQGDFWSGLIERMDRAGRITGMPRELAVQAQLVARDTDQWQLRVDKAALNHAGSRDKLEKALAEHGHAVRLSIEVGRVVDTPAKRQQLRANRWQQEADALIRNDPFVQQMEREFGAKIAPGSIRIVAQ